MRNRLFGSVIGVIGAAVLLIGINLFVSGRLGNDQLDLTQGHIYTISKGTRTVLENLKDPITLRLFYSRKLGSVIPSYGALADRVKQMLDQYASLSHGKLKVIYEDPQPYSDTEDRALAYGLQGVPLDQGGEQIYFGLVGTNQIDTEKTIAFFKPEREPFLEYDLTKLVYELSDPKLPVVGLMTSLPMQGDPRAMMMGQKATPWVSLTELQQSFTIKTVPLETQKIDPDVQVLLVAQAQHLSDTAQYAIDQFVMRGGRLMVMVDPHSEMQASTPGPGGQPPTETSSDLKKLFDAWGIEFDPKQVVGDLQGAWRVRSSNPQDRVQAVQYVAWFADRDGLSHDDPATVDLQQVTVASGGAISKKDGADITFTPLLTTSDQSEVFPVEKVEGNPDPAKLLASFKPDGKRRVIAARVRGVLKSAFTGPPELPKDVKPDADVPAYKAATDGPANLVVIGDSDILGDRFWVRTGDFFGQDTAVPFSDNGAFVSNLVGTLAGGDVLLGLRSRGVAVRPFDMVDRIRSDAEARFRQTEETLQTHLNDVQKQLTDLRGASGPNAQAVMTPAQQTAIEQARQDILTTRQKLRSVQFDLQSDITSLQNELRAFDIVLVPAVLAIVAIVLGILRGRRRARARA
jgi:ABC-type uncharacterized transport system involved in gliding motility auxiliary subunit